MPVTQADIDALNQAIATGERQVTLGAKSVTYRSISDLIAARNDLQTQMAQQQAADAGTVRPRRYHAVYAGRGYDK